MSINKSVIYPVTNFSIFENNFWTDGSLKCSRKHQKCCRHIMKIYTWYFDVMSEKPSSPQLGKKAEVFVFKQERKGKVSNDAHVN